MATVFIGLGSNLSNPVQQVTEACAEIAALKKVRFIKFSSLYQSPPMGPSNQPDYINAVAEIATSLTADELLAELQAIERHHGRVRSEQQWSARTLDLDMLLYGEKIINSERLVIPHMGLYERAFVLYPLLEIAPDLDIPGYGAIAELVQNCERGRLNMVGSISSLNNNDNENQT